MKNEKFYKLVEKVVSLSEAKQFEIAKLEWVISDHHMAAKEDDESCVCGHQHIVHLFEITNVKTKNVLYPIGSECIKKFERNDLNAQVKLAQSKNAIFNNVGKKYHGLTYGEICEKDSAYIEFLKCHAFRRNYVKLIQYYEFYKKLKNN